LMGLCPGLFRLDLQMHSWRINSKIHLNLLSNQVCGVSGGEPAAG